MGDFRMTIEAVGGHGCDRTAKAGDTLRGCGAQDCPDCMFARFVSDMQRAGMRPTVAKMHHWPADMTEHVKEFTTPEEWTCARCNVKSTDGPQDALPCRGGYDEAHEVVDDYTERHVKYPAGAFRRATGQRVKGAF